MANVKKWIIVLCTFIVIIILIIFEIHLSNLNKSYYLKVTPPENMKTLNSYLEWKPETKSIFKVENNGDVYYLCLGERGRALASGPSAYCFDSNYNFAGWTTDFGDLQGSLPEKALVHGHKWIELKIEDILKNDESKFMKEPENNNDAIDNLTPKMFRQIKCPKMDALTVFIPKGQEPSAEIKKVIDEAGAAKWYIKDGGHLVKIPNVFDSYDDKLFKIEKDGWEHEHCDKCGETIDSGVLCWLAELEDGQYLFCDDCYQKLK